AASGAKAARCRPNPGAGAAGDAAALSRDLVRYSGRAQLDHRVSVPHRDDAGLDVACPGGKGLSCLCATARRGPAERRKKGRLTLQAAQVWEERARRTDAAHPTTSFANPSSE